MGAARERRILSIALVGAFGRALAQSPLARRATQRPLRARRVEGRLLRPGRSVGLGFRGASLRSRAGGRFLPFFRLLGG